MINNRKAYGLKKPFTFEKIPTNKLLLVLPFTILTLVLVIIPLILVLVKSMIPANDTTTVVDNWDFVNWSIIQKIFLSLFDAVVTTFFCVLLAYPFTYLLAKSPNKMFRNSIYFIATAPIWTSFLVKLIGLKTFFDVVNGYSNSTYGNIWTIVGLVYLYLPFMFAPLYMSMVQMPDNLVNASRDLGVGWRTTFFKVILPYTWSSLMSGISLVFLPSLTTVAVPQFLNNNADGSLIGDLIVEEGGMASTNEVALARASTLSLLLLGLIVIGIAFNFGVKKIIAIIKYRRDKGE